MKGNKKNVFRDSVYHFRDGRQNKYVPQGDELRNPRYPFVMWGKKNDYPLFINKIYEESPSQTGIINGKVYYMTSGGFTIVPSDPSTEALIKLFEENKNSDYSLLDIIRDCVLDFELYNGFAIKGKWNLQGTAPAFLEHIPFDDVRTNDEEDQYLVSEDWCSSNPEFEEIPAVNMNKRIGEFIVYFRYKGKKVKKGGAKVYPTPPYAGCIKSLLSQIGMQSYHYYEIENSFKTGTILNLPSAKPKSDQDKQIIANEIKAGAVAEEEAGGVLVLFQEGATEAPTVLNLNGNDLDKRYLQTEVSVANTILMCHSITTPSLFGMAVPGQLGNRAELENGFEIMKKTYVESRQRPIAEFFEWIMNNLYGIAGSFKLNPPPPLFGVVNEDNKTSVAISSLSPLVANKVLESMTPNEIRGLAALPPKEGGDEIVSTPKLGTPAFDEHGATDPILKKLLSLGRKKEGFIIHRSSNVPHEVNAEYLDKSEFEMLEEARSEKLFFATVLTETEKNVLALIDDGQDLKSISEALKKPMQTIIDANISLASKGLVKKNGALSELGKKYLDSVEIPVENLEVRYSYELRPGAPKLKSESRPFCKALMRADRLYTRAEIDSLSNEFDTSVWSYRGGWYHNPDTKQNTPYCRHIFRQHVVIKK